MAGRTKLSDADRSTRRKALAALRNRRWRKQRKMLARHAERHALITDYASFLRALVRRRQGLGLSQLAVDQISGLPEAYTGKIEARRRNLGPLSFDLLLATLGLSIALVPRQMRRAVARKAQRRMRRRGSAQRAP
jgi:hypothetical protein